MENEINIMQSVADKKYTEFSTAVKQELINKVANSDTMKNYTSEYDNIQRMKSLFAQISKTGE